MSTKKFTFSHSTVIPHPVSVASRVLISPDPKYVGPYVEKLPIASDFVTVSQELVHMQVEDDSLPLSTARFPAVRTATRGGETPNATRVHFTYVETIPLVLGVTSKVQLEGWYAAPNEGGMGVFEIVANKGGWAETVVRKVKTVEEDASGGSLFTEEVEVEVKWFLERFSKKAAESTHVKYMDLLIELFD